MERFKLSPCGRWMGLVGSGRKGGGVINVLDAGTCQWVAQTRVESRGGVADFVWWGDGNGMTVIGKGGEVLEWDGRERRVVGRWVDEGAVGTTVLALGGKSGREGVLGGDRWVAVGSSSGIVNIYDRRGWGGKDGLVMNPKPTRTLDQLTTATSHLVFSADGQILAMGSRWKRDALRLSALMTTPPLFTVIVQANAHCQSTFHRAPSTATGPPRRRHSAASPPSRSHPPRRCWLSPTSRARFDYGKSVVS